MKLTDFKVLTFDCYGTLIDWETGLSAALQPLLTKAPGIRSREEALEIFAQHEFAQENETPSMPYSQLLSVVYKRLGKAWNVAVSNEEANIFGASVPDWPAFPDSVAALAYLKRHYPLVILSNVDRISFRASNERLQVVFDAVYTAQDIESYKPNPRNFAYLLERLKNDFGLEKSDVLHVAQSLLHDHGPANRCGLASAWIDRRSAKEGWGATKPPGDVPRYDFRFDSMAALVRAHELELSDDPD
jgi:2-haloacid dehalogenase